jgi:hypothetical protein
MLGIGNSQQDVAQWIQALPCFVELPAEISSEFEKSGAAPTVFDEARNVMRVNCRGSANRAALELNHSLPAFPRNKEWQAVYASNISKKGFGFIHSRILYPGERFTLVLLNGVKRVIEVVWCRRLDTNCYEVGSRFIETTPKSDGRNLTSPNPAESSV